MYNGDLVLRIRLWASFAMKWIWLTLETHAQSSRSRAAGKGVGNRDFEMFWTGRLSCFPTCWGRKEFWLLFRNRSWTKEQQPNPLILQILGFRSQKEKSSIHALWIFVCWPWEFGRQHTPEKKHNNCKAQVIPVKAPPTKPSYIKVIYMQHAGLCTSFGG